MTRDALPEPPRWMWLWFPAVFFTVFLLLILRDDTDVGYTKRPWAAYFAPYDEQFGAVELSTPLFSALAVIAGTCALRHRHRLPTRWIRWWVALVTLACFWITGEELSWGQNQLGFEPPEWWPNAVTNLHAIGESDLEHWGIPYFPATWFEEKPRLLLELFVIYGGIIRVLVARKQRGSSGDPRFWFWPTYICLPSALLAILVRMPERLDYWAGLGYWTLVFDPGLVNWRSAQELFFSVFLCMYQMSIWYRVAGGTAHASTDTSGSGQGRTVIVGRQL